MNDSREHILNTSFKLFLQKSFKEVTMKEIVEETGMSKGAFYHYFSSKEQVFEEVIRHYFADLMQDDFGDFSKESLHGFYNDCLNAMENKTKAAQQLWGSKEEFSTNHYFLLFDAMKMLPNFKKELIGHQKAELKAWRDICHTAKKKGEIRSTLSDEQLGKMFIYMGDGLGIQLIMMENTMRLKKDLKLLWDGLYQSLKSN